MIVRSPKPFMTRNHPTSIVNKYSEKEEEKQTNQYKQQQQKEGRKEAENNKNI